MARAGEPAAHAQPLGRVPALQRHPRPALALRTEIRIRVENLQAARDQHDQHRHVQPVRDPDQQRLRTSHVLTEYTKLAFGWRRKRSVIVSCGTMSFESTYFLISASAPALSPRDLMPPTSFIISSIAGTSLSLWIVNAPMSLPFAAFACAFHASAPFSIKKPIWIAARRSEERRVGKECRSRWSPDH